MFEFENYIQPFCYISGVPVTFYNAQGDLKWHCLRNEKVCSFFYNCKNHQRICTKTFFSATKMAAQLGEPYVFLCPSKFIKIAIPLFRNKELEGFFIAGPIAMGNNKENFIKNFFKNITISSDIYPSLTLYLSDIKIFKPKEVAYLASLLNSTILSSIVTNEDYKKINDKFKEQNNIVEDLQKCKKNNDTLDYPYQLEKGLIQKIKNGDIKEAQNIMAALLNEISLIEAGDLSFIKIQVISIFSYISRTTLKQDLSFQISLNELENMIMLDNVDSYNELCLLVSRIIEDFSTNISAKRYSGSSSIVNQATKYVNDHYMNKISLKIVAEIVHTNQSYLSTLFKKEMKINFTDYLNDVRLKKSEDLLISTNLSVVDISLYVGFDSQSYFTKAFKIKNGVTPRQYRKTNQSCSEIV